ARALPGRDRRGHQRDARSRLSRQGPPEALRGSQGGHEPLRPKRRETGGRLGPERRL
ncbi:MAG: hypothetical protein AVDCRST_MAG01-01-4722, partial [uncultured Rubrobacteraceae bacterium]